MQINVFGDRAGQRGAASLVSSNAVGGTPPTAAVHSTEEDIIYQQTIREAEASKARESISH